MSKLSKQIYERNKIPGKLLVVGIVKLIEKVMKEFFVKKHSGKILLIYFGG